MSRVVAPAVPTTIGGRVRAYVALTKPRIVELLLVTTVPTMMVAAGGMPSAWVMIVTLAVTAWATSAWGARRPGAPLKPGFNLFSKQDDMQIGQENAKQVLAQYDVVKNGSDEPIYTFTEDVAQIPGASANQVTIEKLLPLSSLAPGQYTIKIKITDKNRNQVLTPSAQFTVT